MFEPLPADVAAAIVRSSSRLGAYDQIHYRSEVDSTNDIALSLAAAGAAEGTLVLADAQRRGRGRRGHDWFSPAEAGLYLSVVVRPDTSRGGVPLLTIAAGVAMAEAVGAVSGLPVELKWPNDLVVGRPWRKMGGVLAETVSAGTRIEAIVIGMGINVHHVRYPAELTKIATSMEEELGRGVDRAALIVELLAQLRAMMALVHAGARFDIAEKWRRFARAGLNASVRWTDETGVRRGVARDIDDEGALIVAAAGKIERVLAGVVTWEQVADE